MNNLLAYLTVCLLLALSLKADPPATAPTGIRLVETGVDQPDRTPTWYAPMVARPYAPVFEILATRGTQGRYYDYTYAVTLKDIVKFHGHDCEGLTHAACCLKLALDRLFPEGYVDRSVIKAVAGKSPCWSDVTAFLTGARIQYGTLGFFKDKKYEHSILVYRTDTRQAILATWKEGINNIPDEPVALPEKITWRTKVDMEKVMSLKRVVKAREGKPTPEQVDLMRHQQFLHINDILEHPLDESYQTAVMEDFQWENWADPLLTVGRTFERNDIRLKDHPYRDRPILHESALEPSAAPSPTK